MVFRMQGTVTAKTSELPHQITCIDTGHIRPRLAACYLLVEKDDVALIETGTAYSTGIILAVLKLRQLGPENVRYVIPTHVHLDHAGGAGHLMRLFPNAELVVHPRGAKHMINPERLWQGALEVYGEKTMYENYDELIPVDEARVIAADDGFTLDIHGRVLQFIDTPGHARHHFCVFDERSRGCFSGDTFGLAYPEISCGGRPYIMPTTSPVQFDPDAWYASLDRLMTLEPKRMYLTHFGMVEQVEELKHELEARIARYVEIAEQYPDAKGRCEQLFNQLMTSTLEELKSLGCTLPPVACRALLQMDLKLNAQGIDFWLDARSR